MDDYEPLTPAYDEFVEEVPGRLHGRRAPLPIYAATRHCIRTKLYGKRPIKAPSKRTSLIIQRANWMTQLMLRVPCCDFDSKAFQRSMEHARRHHNQFLDVNLAPDYMPPMELLQDTFPFEEEDLDDLSDQIEEFRKQMTKKNLYEHRSPMDLFNRPMAQLRSEPISRCLEIAMRKVCQDHEPSKITKIVAFGDHGVLYWDDKMDHFKNKRHSDEKLSERECFMRASMWSSLFLMKENLVKHGVVKADLPIFVQDTGFRTMETENFERRGVEVLCGAYGHQQGFVELDRETMVVLFCHHVNTIGLIMEITDPAMVFVNEHLQSQMPPLFSDTEALGYWLGEDADLNIPSGNVPFNYHRFFTEYVEVPLSDRTDQESLPQLQPSGRFFVRKRK